MKVTKEDIIYICWLPLILLALLMGAILMWTAWGLFFLYGAMLWLWEVLKGIDYGFDRDFTRDVRK